MAKITVYCIYKMIDSNMIMWAIWASQQLWYIIEAKRFAIK
jgi:hypothetical protein